MDYRPLSYFWVTEFSDNSAISQFNPDTGEENKAHPDWLPSKTDKEGMIVKDGKRVLAKTAYEVPEYFKGKRIIRIGWYPFSLSLAQKVYTASEKLVFVTEKRPVVINIEDGEEPICYRSHSIELKLKGGQVTYGPVIYILGVKGRPLRQINEQGEILA